QSRIKADWPPDEPPSPRRGGLKGGLATHTLKLYIRTALPHGRFEMMSQTNRLSLPSAFNLATVALLLWVAIGITCEITTRIEDFGRVSSYQKWLLTCLTNPGQDKTCHPTDDEYAADI